MTCGHVHAGLHTTLVCNLEYGHAGPHGIRQWPGLQPYVLWEAK